MGLPLPAMVRMRLTVYVVEKDPEPSVPTSNRVDRSHPDASVAFTLHSTMPTDENGVNPLPETEMVWPSARLLLGLGTSVGGPHTLLPEPLPLPPTVVTVVLPLPLEPHPPVLVRRPTRLPRPMPVATWGKTSTNRTR